MDLVVGVNSYMDIKEADSIVNDIYFSDDEEYKLWQSLDEKDKQKVIIKGTEEIDRMVFLGIKKIQWGMSWPRYLYGEEVECPLDIKKAILSNTLKNKIYSKTKEQQLQDIGVSSYKVRDASISFGNTNSNSGNSKINGIYSDIYNKYLCKWTY